jgi:predicted RNase H-related nuclease YkuK (DUF458 family)
MKERQKLKFEWKKYDGTPIDNPSQYVRNWVKAWPYGEIMIGCDSQAHPRHIKYSISINMHMIDEYEIGHGGHVIFANVIDYNKSVKDDLYTKLWAEAELSVQAAQEIEAETLEAWRIVIHLDYNSKVEAYSNILYTTGLGYVRGMFNGNVEVFGKPDAWAASSTSDMLCKNKQAKGIK